MWNPHPQPLLNGEGSSLTWAKEIKELRRREAMAEAMGGAEKVARQHGRGKLDARARIAGLVDAGDRKSVV